MLYTPITDGEEVRRAFESLRDAFRTSAEERIGASYGYGDIPRYRHPEKNNLEGKFIDRDEKGLYTIVFECNGRTVMHMSIPKEGEPRGNLTGLFVQDEEENRYLTHTGIFPLRVNGRGVKKVRKKLINFTDDDCWIDVVGRKNFWLHGSTPTTHTT